MKSKMINSGDILGMIEWLEAPENKFAAADSVSFGQGKGKQSDLVNFMLAHDEFKGWSRGELEDAIELANTNDLMENKSKQKITKRLLEKFIDKQVKALLKEETNKATTGEIEQMMLDITSRLRLLSSKFVDLHKQLPRMQDSDNWQDKLDNLNTQIISLFTQVRKSFLDYNNQEKTPIKGIAP